MTFLESLLLGIVQGVFMFLPVSSTAHLVVAQHLLIRGGSELPPPESAEMILFDLVVHVGTLVSIAVVFRKSLGHFIANLWGEAWRWAGRKGTIYGGWLYLRLMLLGLFTVFVTGVIGLTFKVVFQQAFATPAFLAVTLTLTGVLLWWTDRLPPRHRSLRKIGPGTAAIIGVAQGLSLIPGLSRSGMTIVFGLFAGLKRRWAAEYSFFVAFPTILAATAVQGAEVFAGDGLGGVSWAAMTGGFVAAALVGIVALKLVLALLYRAKLKVFSFYLWALALAVALGFLDNLL